MALICWSVKADVQEDCRVVDGTECQVTSVCAFGGRGNTSVYAAWHDSGI